MNNMNLKTALDERVAGPLVRNTYNSTVPTFGIVVAADETSNLCKVIYYDGNGTMKTAKNCMVDLRHGPTGWFPKMVKKGKEQNKNTSGGQEKDLPRVLFQPDGMGSGTVLSEYTDEYAKDIKPKTKFNSDITNNGDSNLCSGQITPY